MNLIMDKQQAEIIKLLKRKQETCVLLLQKMQEQMKAVNNQDDSRLAVVIEDKERLIVGLNETDQKIAGLAADLDVTSRESLVRENAELARCIEADLEKIIAQEIVCQEKLSLTQNEVLEKLRGVKNGQTLLRGYGVPPRIKPRISRKI